MLPGLTLFFKQLKVFDVKLGTKVIYFLKETFLCLTENCFTFCCPLLLARRKLISVRNFIAKANLFPYNTIIEQITVPFGK